MNELSTVDLLIIDDFALEPMSRDERRDVYQLSVERTGRPATIITSDRDTGEWLATFDDVLLAQSAVDRLSNAAYEPVIEGESYRPRQNPKISDDDPVRWLLGASDEVFAERGAGPVAKCWPANSWPEANSWPRADPLRLWGCSDARESGALPGALRRRFGSAP